MVGIDEVEADGCVLDGDLARSWGTNRYLLPSQNLWAAGAAEADGAGFLHVDSDRLGQTLGEEGGGALVGLLGGLGIPMGAADAGKGVVTPGIYVDRHRAD